ncbi:MAG: PLP-dependent aminotransferase family protein [Eubacteriaceae bacterium]|nr:PLP-dependent aminotransferase family protein [Eubacteriaceae bacterium]
MIDRFIIDRKSDIKLYLQIYRYFKDEILFGRMPEGKKLPSVRELARALNVSKITVEASYNQLAAEGYIDNIPRRGYFAVELKDLSFVRTAIKSSEELPIRKYINTGVDKDSFDLKLWKKLYGGVLNTFSDDLFDGGDLQGELLLRKEICIFIGKSRGVVASPDQIVIGSGSQYLLGIIASLIKKRERTVIVEDPGFSMARNVFEDYGIDIHPVQVDSDGIRSDLLSQSPGRVAYLSPSHQYPMGTVMPIKRRLEVLNWVKDKDGIIIEDDYDSIIRYETEPIPSLQGLDQGHHVVYMGSFSKLLTPAVRISYMVLTQDLTEEYKKYKERFTQTASKLEQLTMGMFMKDGHFERHMKRINKIYYRKNITLKEVLKKYSDKGINVLGGNSGLHLIIRVESESDSVLLMENFIKNDVLLERIKVPEDNSCYLLLTYSGIPVEIMEELISKLMG